MANTILRLRLFWVTFTTAGVEACYRRMRESSELMEELEVMGGEDTFAFAFANLRWNMFRLLGTMFVGMMGTKREDGE